MHYVYILKSLQSPEKIYIGSTGNLKKRLADHNSGNSFHTNKYKPWEMIMYCAFKDKKTACEFEQYLKSGSGHAFASKHFLIQLTQQPSTDGD